MARSLAKDSIPTGWKYDLLDKFATRCSGHTPSKSFPEYWDGGIKWISLADSSRLDKGYVFETDKEISEVGIANSSAELHPAETVVLSRDAGIGKSGVMAVPMAVSQHFIAWKCDNTEKLNSWFLYNWLQLNKAEFERQAVGSTIKTIGLPYFKKLKIAVPPYIEQKKIAQILSTWDKAITTNEQLLANSQQQKKAIMQQLLTGKRRLLDKNGVRFSGRWNFSLLSELGATYSGLTGKTKDDFGKGKPYIPYINIFRNSRIDLNALEKVDISSDEKQAQVRYGDVFFTTSSEVPEEVGMSSVLLEHTEELYLNSFCFGFRLSSFEVLQPEYARYLFRSEQVRRAISVMGQGATRYNLSKKQLMKLELNLPPIAEQQKIAAVLSVADQEIFALQQKLEALKQEKKALMQQLLTGKRRVKIDDKEFI
ncbi:restriction endonuclease subunit S [Providencia stuartii]|uniref:Restriction endonuclease subunit S n=1 Tax=Providencia stuartii TaxID=588 RepID=A0AAJ1N2Y7_PROST|nr:MULTISPECIES: restriction endonuclease subunit S [Providencia]AIN62794.1 type I restriction modification DNA specificity domain protein [Providencia stuartii]EMA3640045.1 restriction endonuclease subunit S [Providencia stuartii]MBK1418863.1 restriction endonuclease subunit S [Providencia stuartii]MBW3101723.1 restriction endonuclease subunit S [Providencia stuartii]MCB5218772.1 restriction endonuclease subunit S [Providencia stuartii]